MYERWVETGRDSYIDPSSSLDHSGTSFATWPGLLNRGSLRARSSVSWFSLWHSCLNWLTAAGTLSIFFLNVHMLPLFLGLFTQVHLLINGSVESQYITNREVEEKNKRTNMDLGPSLDCYLNPIVLFCLLFSTGSPCLLWDLLSLVHFWSRGRARPRALWVGFAPKQTKVFSDWRQHKRKWMLPLLSHWYICWIVYFHIL